MILFEAQVSKPLQMAYFVRHTGQLVLTKVEQAQRRAVTQKLRKRRERIGGEVALSEL